MRIAVIGAGFTGLTAAYHLSKKGYHVTVFEKDSLPGGLALGFNPQEKNERTWQWDLEKYYHHLFTNDQSILNLAKEINSDIVVKRPKTSIFLEESIYQLDSPKSLITFPKLTIFERIRMAISIALLRYNPFWKPLEKIKIVDFLPKLMGKIPYGLIWESQLIKKFGIYADKISMAWFWARIKKRTTKLAYPKKGFLELANLIIKKIEINKGKFLFNQEVISIKSSKSKIEIEFKSTENNNISNQTFDKVIVTLPSSLFLKIVPEIPIEYKNKFKNFHSIGAISLILRLKKQFLTDNTYWLSICDYNYPFMAIIEHTNFIEKKYYNGEHLIYIGNYLPQNHDFFKLEKDKLLEIFDPYLKKINPNYRKEIINYHLFKTLFAQPIIPLNYSKILPSFKTPIKNLYLANIDQVYPWDRGTNYAVELGEKITEFVQQRD